VGHIWLLTSAAAAGVLVSGVVLAGTGEALAQQTKLGTSFVGMLLGGVATSLPEVTTTIAAVRLAQYEMAFADAFGTNLFSTMLLFVADLAERRHKTVLGMGVDSIIVLITYAGGLIVLFVVR
jgi:cation:H+ antiporter